MQCLLETFALYLAELLLLPFHASVCSSTLLCPRLVGWASLKQKGQSSVKHRPAGSQRDLIDWTDYCRRGCGKGVEQVSADLK